MGQRLTFRIIKGGECIASIYYHWSAYTDETYVEAIKLIYGLRMRGYDKGCSNEDAIILLEDVLESNSLVSFRGTDRETITVGGVDANCYEEFSEIYKAEYGKDFVFCNKQSRNNGIIAVGEYAIKQQEYWGESVEEFNFDTETFTNSIWEKISNIEEFIEDYLYEGDNEDQIREAINNLPVIDPDSLFGTISFDDAVDVCQRFVEYYETSPLKNKAVIGKTESGDIIHVTMGC